MKTTQWLNRKIKVVEVPDGFVKHQMSPGLPTLLPCSTQEMKPTKTPEYLKGVFFTRSQAQFLPDAKYPTTCLCKAHSALRTVLSYIFQLF